MPRLRASEWSVLVGAVLLVVAGLVAIGLATGTNIDAAQTRQTWVDSGAEKRAELAVAQPTPIWLPATPEPSSGPVYVPAPIVAVNTPAPTAHPSTISVISLLDASFVFVDPPQPGAHARVSLRATSGGPDAASIALVFPATWFDSYRITGTIPSSERVTDADGVRLVFANLAPGDLTLEVDVVSTGEGIAPPRFEVQQGATGDVLSQARPQTVAPRPAPGPVSALRIPRLGVNVAVVARSWEPPPFIVGQLKGSANVGQGNTVLVGDLTGAAGAVFKQLDDLSPGDTVVAVSRGLEYTFTVSDKQTRPADDSAPMTPGDTPRLTLMTCTRTWDPIARDYSDRLWVTAEPPEVAAATIAANAARPPTPTPVPTSTADLVEGDGDVSATDSPAVSTVPAVATVDVPGALGADRSTFDAAYAAPLGETAGRLVVYRKGSADYHVGFTPDPPRARLIALTTRDPAGTLNPATAIGRAQALFPPDGRVLGVVREERPGLFVERLASKQLAGAMDVGLGHFLAAYSRDASGAVTRVVVALGDDLDAVIGESIR